MRTIIQRRVLVGLVAGILATLAYDLSRYLVVTLFPIAFWPFHVFTIFGQLLIGRASRGLLFFVGWLYHMANGAGFAVCYTILFPRPGILSGLIFAAVLEFLMISLYPSWLGFKAYGEFFTVSIVGHASYGLALGWLTKWGVAHFERSGS